MKTKNSFLFLAFIALSLLFSGCDKNDNIEIDDDDSSELNIGVHKFIIEVTGDDDVIQVANFVGSTETGLAKLYDEDGKYKGESYLESTTVGKTKRIVCQSSDKCINLILAYNLAGSKNEKATVKIKSYIGDKQIHNMEESLGANGDSFYYQVTLTTDNE